MEQSVRKRIHNMIIARSQIGRVGKGVIFKILIAAVCFCLWTSLASAANNPREVVKTGTNQVIHLLKEYPQDTPSLRQKIRAVVNEYFDFHTIALRALGPIWRQQSPEKLKEFTRDFSQLLFNTYIGKIEKYTDERITYNLKQEGGDYAVVEAIVTGGQTGEIPIVYYLHLKDGNWKVYDVVIEGMGLVTNYRDQFNAILSRSSFDDLLRQLKEKISQG